MLTGNTKTDVDLNLEKDNNSQYFIHGDVILMLSTENWSIIIIIPKITLWPSEPTLLHYEWLIVLLSDDRGLRKSFIKYHFQKEGFAWNTKMYPFL